MSKDEAQKVSKPKVLKGKVISTDGSRTAVVSVERYFKHPLYKKYITRSKKYKVDDPDQLAEVGKKVSIVETRPISKTKHFRVLEII